jgi:hypothetical protein
MMLAFPVTVREPVLPVAATPVTETSAAAVTLGDPKLVVAAVPLTCTMAAAITLGDPVDAVID